LIQDSQSILAFISSPKWDTKYFLNSLVSRLLRLKKKFMRYYLRKMKLLVIIHKSFCEYRKFLVSHKILDVSQELKASYVRDSAESIIRIIISNLGIKSCIRMVMANWIDAIFQILIQKSKLCLQINKCYSQDKIMNNLSGFIFYIVSFFSVEDTHCFALKINSPTFKFTN